MKGTAAMTTADADGIEIAGLLFDAGPSESPVLLEVGPEESRARHAKDPITLHDVFFRVGRSEEHTSELQSRLHLVCRLLLEKKKQQTCAVRLDAEHARLCAIR